MFLKEVEISNALGIQSAKLCFNNEASVYVVQCDSTCPILSSFGLAVQLIFSTKYAHDESLQHLHDIYNGYIRIVFVVPHQNLEPDDLNQRRSSEFDDIPCTSQQAQKMQALKHTSSAQEKAKYYEIVAYRNFRTNPDNIEFRIDNNPKQTCSPTAFHGMFRTNVDYIFPEIEHLYSTRKGNLLNLLVQNLNSKWNQDMQLCEYFIDLFKMQENQFLQKVCTAFLNANNAIKRIKQLHIMKICHDIRRFFEFITCDEYTVWFFITYQGQKIDMDDIVCEELDFDDIETCIQLKNEKVSRLIDWSKSDKTVKDLLLIALDLAIAYNYERSIVVIRQMSAIKEFQAMEMSIIAHLESRRNVGNISWIKMNYLQRIIDACNKMEIMAIIQYRGGIPFSPMNSNVIKCVDLNTSNEGWSMVVLNTEVVNEDNIIKCIQENVF